VPNEIASALRDPAVRQFLDANPGQAARLRAELQEIAEHVEIIHSTAAESQLGAPEIHHLGPERS